ATKSLQSQRPRSPRETASFSSCNSSRTAAAATATAAGRTRARRGRVSASSPPSTEERNVDPGARTETSLPRRNPRQSSLRRGDGSRRADPPNPAVATGALAAAKDIEGEQRQRREGPEE
ncbi:unnamed protein product, partial [Laminaria digitata]